ncbi:MAG: hypothetical protein AB7P21_00740 [Lautropia sp.]
MQPTRPARPRLRPSTLFQAATIGTPLVVVAAIESATGASLASTRFVSGAALVCALVLLFLGLFFPGTLRPRAGGGHGWFAPQGPLAMFALVVLMSIALTLLFFFA